MTVVEAVNQTCTVCGGFDAHPRHVIYTWEAVHFRHMDCCASSGCPDGSCRRILEQAGNAHGDTLTAWITGRHPAWRP